MKEKEVFPKEYPYFWKDKKDCLATDGDYRMFSAELLDTGETAYYVEDAYSVARFKNKEQATRWLRECSEFNEKIKQELKQKVQPEVVVMKERECTQETHHISLDNKYFCTKCGWIE